jgi:hypothetical protein
MSDDARLEGSLRELLRRRDPGGAPETLRLRLANLARADSAAVGRSSRWRSFAALAAAALVGLFVIVVWLPRTIGGPGVSNPGAPASTLPAPSWPPILPGTATGPDLRIAVLGAAILIVVTTVALIRVRRSHVRVRQIALGLSIFAFLGLGVVETQYAPLGQGAVSGPVLPQDRRVDPESVTGGHSAVYVFYRSGGDFQIGFSVRNDGPLATTFDGLGNALALNQLRFFRFVDLRLPRDPAVGLDLTDDTTQPFRPIDLAPGADVYLIARFQFATCEQADLPVVPGQDAPESETSRGFSSIETMSVRSHVFFAQRTTDIPLGIVAAFPQPTRCAH